MSITVYSISGAPRPWRVLLGLAFKGLDYDVKLLEASKGEHKAAEYLAINPRGMVPSLDYNGLILRDSIGILAWLDREFPETPLFGKTPAEAAEIWQITLDACDYLRAAANEILFSIMVLGAGLPEEGSAERKAKQAAADLLKKECEQLELLLAKNSYLAGNEPSAADAICFPEIRLIQRAVDMKYSEMNALGLANMAGEFPKLEAWKIRVSKLPNVDETMPPHWSQQG